LLYRATAVGNIFKWKSRMQVVWELLFCCVFRIISFICSKIILGNICHMNGEFMSRISETVCLSIIRGQCDKWHNQYPQHTVRVHCPHPTVGCFRGSKSSQTMLLNLATLEC
jgi:hypothetical protein